MIPFIIIAVLLLALCIVISISATDVSRLNNEISLLKKKIPTEKQLFIDKLFFFQSRQDDMVGGVNYLILTEEEFSYLPPLTDEIETPFGYVSLVTANDMQEIRLNARVNKLENILSSRIADLESQVGRRGGK